MISIPQLDLQVEERTQGKERASIFSCGRHSVFTWGDAQVTVPHCPPSKIPLLLCKVSSQNDDFNYEDFHAAFMSTHQSDRPERLATDTATIDPIDEVCEGEQQDPDEAEVHKQVDFSKVMKKAQAIQVETLTKAQRELLSWHYRLGHLSFKQLQALAKQRRIPKQLADCVAPKCPTCLFGKMTKRAWRTKGKSEQSIRKDHEDYPGANTSVDQMETTTLGLIPQSTGKLLRAKYNGATVFVDHHSNFTYLHLMTSLDGEQTMAAKEAYEQLAQTYGINVRGY